MPQVKTAFLSTFNKSLLSEYAIRLANRGIELWASSGTAKHLLKTTDAEIPVKSIEELTGFDKLLDGRVKTLHPAVFSAILARQNDHHIAQIEQHGYPLFDMVFVDLYPFIENLDMARPEKLIELIDIGGVALLRAAAKNFCRVVPVFLYEQLDMILDSLDEKNNISQDISRQLARETFFYTATYDSTIARWLTMDKDETSLPTYFAIGGKSATELRYGENPHQQAKIYKTEPNEGIPAVEILGGKKLSYNNFLDLDSALTGAIEFEEPSCTIVKHLSPCGMAIGDTAEQAYDKALASDPLSAFGGIVAFNRPVTEELANKINRHFFECVLAPAYQDNSVNVLAERKNLRILKLPELAPVSQYIARGIFGGMLVQNVNPPGVVSAKWEIVSKRKPTEREEDEMRFAMRCAKIIKSNTVVISKNFGTVGIGGGLPSRVDSAILAVKKAGDNANGAVAASDAFMPFPDTLYVLAQAGVTAIIQPGGSRNDNLAIEAADKLGIAMVFTGMRHFKH